MPTLFEKVIEELNLGISYYQHGFLQSNELFGNSPFKVEVDSSHLQLTGVNFKIIPLNNEEFTLSISKPVEKNFMLHLSQCEINS